MHKLFVFLSIVLSFAHSIDFDIDSMDFEMPPVPECEAQEACAYSVPEHAAFMGAFSFCACPGGHRCPHTDEKNGTTLTTAGFEMTFCTVRKVPKCERGQVSMIVEGFRKHLMCTCEAPYKTYGRPSIDDQTDATEYVCDVPRAACKPADTCSLRHVRRGDDGAVRSVLRARCMCAANERCEMSATPVIQQKSFEDGSKGKNEYALYVGQCTQVPVDVDTEKIEE